MLHETPDYRLARRRSRCCRPDPRRSVPCSGAKSPISSAGHKALLLAQSRRLGAQPVFWPRPFEPTLCNPKALWKLNWFLRDFGYDTELLGRDEVDESQLLGLKGVVKLSHIVLNNASLIRLDGFASASRWEELSPANLDNPQVA